VSWISLSDGDSFAGATIKDEPIDILDGNSETMANRAKMHAANGAIARIATT
jgi:hypothetical protein